MLSFLGAVGGMGSFSALRVGPPGRFFYDILTRDDFFLLLFIFFVPGGGL